MIYNISIEVSHEETFSGDTLHDARRIRGTGVYILYGDGDVPLYVGMSKNLGSRLSQHIRGDGASEVFSNHIRKISVKFVRTVREADILETHIINELAPVYNVAKAAHDEFIKDADSELLEADERLTEIEGEIEDLYEDYYPIPNSFAGYALEDLRQEERVLKARRTRLLRNGARPLFNKTGEEIAQDERRRKRMAYLHRRKI